jgi:hypothetical protein
MLASCAVPYRKVSYSDVFEGRLEVGAHVRVRGKMDTSGINFYSLQDQAGGEGYNCVALILSQSGRKRAKSLNGKDVTVLGNVLGAGDLDTILPNQDGEINGRFWGGTKCNGSHVIYVTSLRR